MPEKLFHYWLNVRLLDYYLTQEINLLTERTLFYKNHLNIKLRKLIVHHTLK